ncbi:MAG: hypothetical protein ACFFD1_15355, partial [Candidatus Thorarchaeota archaeon]
MSVPKELISNISKDEMILYTSDNLINKHSRKIEKVLFIILWMAITAGFYSLVARTLISDWLEGNFGILDILLFLIPLIGAVGFPFLFRSMINTHKKDEYLLITNKMLYIYRYSYERKSQTMQVVDLNSIIGLTYKRGRFNEKGDFGNLEIIWSEHNERGDNNIFEKDNSHTQMYLLKNIPNFTQMKRLLESILYSFGGIQEKWKQIKESVEWRIPMIFQISEKKFEGINKRRKKLLFYILLIPIICCMILITLLTFIDVDVIIFSLTESPMVFAIYFIGLVLTPTLGVAISLTMIYERKKIKKRCSSMNTKLVIQTNDILYEDSSETNFSDMIPLGKNTVLSYCKIKKPFDKSLRWEENIDGIVICPSF